MAEKLNTGEVFPKLTLDLVDGTTLALPDGLDARYKVILFYRSRVTDIRRAPAALERFPRLRAAISGTLY